MPLGEADDPLAQWHTGEDLIGQQGGNLGHAASGAAGAESALFARKCHQPLEVAFVAAHPKEPVFESAALQVGLKLTMDMLGQGFALPVQMINQGRIVRLDELVEQCLLGLMPFVGSSTKAFLALCQHGGSALDSHRAERIRLGQQLEECHFQSVK